MNCLENYLATAHVRSDKPAIIFFKGLHSLEKSTSFNELYINATKAQTYLINNGYKKGDSLLLFEQPGANLYAFILAAMGLGVKLLIIEPWMKGSAINEVLKKIEPKGMMTNGLGKLVLLKAKRSKNIQHKFNSKVLESISDHQNELEVIDCKSDDHAILTFTSGTSGQPKGVHRKHQYLIDQASVLKKYLPYDQCQKLDLTVFTNIVLLNLTLGKGSLVIPSNWKKSIIRQLDHLPDEYQVDTMASGPTFLNILLDNTTDLKLEALHLGGALADNSLYERAIKRWPDAQFHHVYGSTEAEPVAVSDLALATQKSRSLGYFQNLYIGSSIDEIKLERLENTTWVSGVHVSPMYENDEVANSKNKKMDADQQVWHNMGDRLNEKDGELYYGGRDFQSAKEFQTEQEIYTHLQSSHSYLMNINGKLTLLGENVEKHSTELMKKFPIIKDVIERKIIRDVRHRARIDREKSFTHGVVMHNYMTFIKERVPVIANLILAFGLLLSTSYLYGHSLSALEIILSVLSLLVFITELRFMDELKDYDKDKIAHPDRPLPRGVITTQQVSKLIVIFFGLLVGCAIASGILFNMTSAIMLLITSGWLYLMYKEFFIPKLINKSPIIYAISHQIIIVPIIFYLVSLLTGELIFDKQLIGLTLVILSSFFSFEVGRKMDPNADPILGTYLIHYKKLKTNILITLLLSLSVIGAVLLNKLIWVSIPIVLILITQIRIYINSSKFKDLEGIIALNLIYNMWFIMISEVIK